MTQAEYTESLIKKWESVLFQARHVFTWSGQGEMAYIAEMASKSSLAVEHGVYMGASSLVMLLANPKLHLWPCDPFMVAGTEHVTRFFLRHHIAAGRCEVIPKGSVEASRQLSHMAGKLDLVFVDNGHSREDVLLDIDCWLPMLRSGGVLCGHDLDQNPDNGVAEAVKERLTGWTEPVPRIWSYIKP